MSEASPASPTSLHEAPRAERRPHVDHYQGETFEDPYYWLRERDDPSVRAYLEAENAYTETATAPLRDFRERLYEEMLARIQQTDLTVPVRRGDYLYYSRTVEGLQYPIHCRKLDPDGAEQVLLDQNELAAGHAFCSLGAFTVSDDGRWLAYTVDTTGMRRYRLQIKDLDNGRLLEDSAERVTSVEWASDNRTLVYTTEDEQTKRSDRCYRRALGGESIETFYEADELYHIAALRTRDRRFLLLSSFATDSTEYRTLDSEHPEREWELFLPRRRDHKYDVDHREGLFYVRTNQGAKNFRVVTWPVAAPWPDLDDAPEFLAHPADSQPPVLIEGLDLFQDFAVTQEKVEGLTRLRIYDFAQKTWRALQVPEPVYALYPGGNPEFDSEWYRYTYQSFVTPSSVMEHHLRSGQTVLRKQQPVLGGYEPSRYESARLWAVARDGTRIPMSAVWRRGAARPGPLLLYGYGSYGYGLEAGFSSARLSLLDRGVTYVIAHVRGGNELGETWHDDGMLGKKKNTFFDFLDCAEYLIESGWTTPAQLAIEGGSAGGLLIGATLNLAPDRFCAAHLAVPFVDVINTMMDETLPLTTGEYLEWGDPHDPATFAYMRSYSPYDNLERRRYPAILVTTSLHDSQVMYWEPAKYVAKLRWLRGSSAEGPETRTPELLLKTNLAAGHGGASGRYDKLRETAFEFAWLLHQLGADT